ncbi:hypothetical protein CTAYLR_008930 [Chrysophaeum taylorii]|uniref:Carbohydrate kinase PfkB domain-containing protein n=1 Tax=Chrysophaeum taylorii TaxID=2483200 RepID=A0AAD7UJP9_9STRA|nr:hypothetical protein CTAYLR_008930 [Chrysophaeum taylorii]
MVVVVVGLNGAVQRRVRLKTKLAPGTVNRGVEASTGVGGKGQGAWLAARAAGLGDALLAQFCDDDLETLLRRRAPGCDEGLWVRVASKTRVCTTLVDDEDATEIVEPSGEIQSAEFDELLRRLPRAAAVLVMGSIPPGLDASAYRTIVDHCAPSQLVLLDTVHGLREGAWRGAVLKVNARELLGLAGIDDDHRSDSAAPRDADQLGNAAALVARRFGFEAVLWTDSKFPAGALVDGALYSLRLPALPGSVSSPIGAGDAVAGATLAGFVRPQRDDRLPRILAAFAFGLACGAASCLTPDNAAFDIALARQLRADTNVLRLH